MSYSRITAIVIGGLSSLFSLVLVYHQILTPPFCPALFGIPACYIVLLLYISAVAAASVPVSSKSNIIYFASAGTGLAIGFWFSSRQISGASDCPVLFNIPIPLCYASLLAFLALIVLRWQEIKNK